MPRDGRLRSDLEEQIHDLDREDATLLFELQKKPKTEDVDLEGVPAIKTLSYGYWIWVCSSLPPRLPASPPPRWI